MIGKRTYEFNEMVRVVGKIAKSLFGIISGKEVRNEMKHGGENIEEDSKLEKIFGGGETLKSAKTR